MSTDDKTPALKQASDLLKPHEPKLLDAFAKVFRRKRPPQSMRALAPLAMVFLLEAFGLAFLLDRATVRAAIIAARGPGKGDDEDEPQMSILDATMQDGLLGVFVADISLRSESPPVIECMGQTLDLGACDTLDAAAWRAVSKGWIAYLDHRGAVVGLRLIPRTDGIQTRLRAPLANIVAMYAPDKRDEQIANLQKNIEEINQSALRREISWQDATGASDPEMARELTAQRVEQIKSFDDRAVVTTHADGHTMIVVDNSDIDAGASEVEVGDSASPGIWRMVWPDKDAAPDPLACANAIVAHRRGEFAELEFPSTPKIFENVRAWLMFHQFGVRSPQPDATGYCTCAIGPGGEIPPSWSSMKEAKRNAYPGFVLFAPDGSARVVFKAKEPSIGKVGKRKAREPKS